LLHGYYQDTKGAPKNQALQEAIGIFESKANFEGPECPVFTRLAPRDGRIYLDLSNDAWEAVEICPGGWRVLSDVPVKFRRARGMSSLPDPVRGGGCVNDLRRFVNIASEQDWMLLVTWLVAAFPPHGPYPILVLHGEQGSAKSTTSRVLRALLDPNTAPLRWKDYAHGNKKRKMTLSSQEFLRRFLLHVLPRGFVPIRSFGFLANRRRATLLPLCRRLLLNHPQPQASALIRSSPAPPAGFRCPKCATPMVIVEGLSALTAGQFPIRCPVLDSS